MILYRKSEAGEAAPREPLDRVARPREAPPRDRRPHGASAPPAHRR